MLTGFLISAPQSGSGKTVITLGLLRALKNRKIAISPFKAGPDYLDPLFHSEAAQYKSYNLDCWAMSKQRIEAIIAKSLENNRLIVVEGMMGLFDGAAGGNGSTAELSTILQLPIIMVVDCAKQSHSIAALVHGFASHRSNIKISGLILNRVGSQRHELMLRQALEELRIPILGAIYRNDKLTLPSRYLGLVQPSEIDGLEQFLQDAAEIIGNSIDIDALLAIATHPARCVFNINKIPSYKKLPPLGQHIAIAKDQAFSFNYAHIINDWREAGAEITFFSPLKNEGPAHDADAIYLGGGYPELFADRLEAAAEFKSALKRAAAKKCVIYGECGGFMVLGDRIEDQNGVKRSMLGLLPLETSFRKKKLHLGYCELRASHDFIWNFPLRGHEFHYSSISNQGEAEPLFYMRDAMGDDLGPVGMRLGSVAGSYVHVIDARDQ